MKVKLKRDFTCHPPATPGRKVRFPKGEVIEGEIAEWALKSGAGDEIKESKPKATKASAPKGTKDDKGAPENKSND